MLLLRNLETQTHVELGNVIIQLSCDFVASKCIEAPVGGEIGIFAFGYIEF